MELRVGIGYDVHALEKGFDLIIDTPTLRKGYMNSPDAELYVLRSFPVKAIKN